MHLLRLAAVLAMSVGRALGADPDGTGAPVAPRFLPIPKTPWRGFTDMVVEPGGTVWIMANQKVFYWAGSEFREPVSGPMRSGYYLAGLYGGPDRGAYATQEGKGEREACQRQRHGKRRKPVSQSDRKPGRPECRFGRTKSAQIGHNAR